MKRTFFPALILVVLSLLVLPARAVVAETLVFPGKAYCGLKDDTPLALQGRSCKARKKSRISPWPSASSPPNRRGENRRRTGSDMTSLRVLAVNLQSGST
jgi:hypothetical protein